MGERMKPAALLSAAILVFMLVQQVVSMLSYLGAMPAAQVSTMTEGIARLILVSHLPFVVGVFVSLWLVTPFEAGRRLGSALGRSALAAAAGSALVVIAHTVVFSADAFAGVGSFVGNSFPALPIDRVANAFGIALQAGANSFLQLLPLVMLGALLVRMRVSGHPSPAPVSVKAGEV